MGTFPIDKFREFLKKPESETSEETVVLTKVESVTPKEPEELDSITENISEKDEFAQLGLSTDELMEIKKIALSDILEQDISVSELVDLVLLSKSSKSVKDKNKDGLLIREYIDRDGKITRQGRLYLEFDETRERLKKLLK